MKRDMGDLDGQVAALAPAPLLTGSGRGPAGRFEAVGSSGPVAESKAGHLFGLDLVRCVAILLVLANHCGLAFTAWNLAGRPAYLDTLGYYGVELFFVLSGFLIGGILLDVIAAAPTARDWLVFMARRWMRTLPLYYVWLVVIAAAWPPGPMHDDWGAAWRLLSWYVWFGQNLAWPADDWFAVSWSLAIEEWFYLTFSLVLLTCARAFGARRAMAAALPLFLAVPLALRLIESPYGNWNEYLHKAVMFRLDAIAFGVLAITVIRLRALSTKASMSLLAAGVAMIALQSTGLLTAADVLGPRISRALGFDVTDLGFALLLPGIALLPKPSAWLNTPVRLFAAQSYGTYLMHYSLLQWMGAARGATQWSGLTTSLIAAALILVLPAASWHLFEKPLLALRPAGRGSTAARRLSHAS